MVVKLIFKFAMKNYLEDAEFRNISIRTIKHYSDVLNEFYDYMVKNEIVNVEDVNKTIVKSYILDCQKRRKNNPTTSNSKLRALKTFFTYCETELEIFNSKTNPCQNLTYAKEDVKIEPFSDEQIRQMLNYYQKMKYKSKTFYAYRDYFLIIWLLGTGARLGETINLRWQDIDLENDIVKVIGKKRVDSTIPMGHKLKKEILEYKLFVEQKFKILPVYVFTNQSGGQLQDSAIKSVFKRLQKVMNFKNRLSAHSFRHTFSRKFLTSGGNAFGLKRMLRHSSINQTQRYVNLYADDIKHMNDQFNPLNNIDV